MIDFCWYPSLHWLKSGIFDNVDALVFLDYPCIQKFMIDIAQQIGDEESEDNVSEYNRAPDSRSHERCSMFWTVSSTSMSLAR